MHTEIQNSFTRIAKYNAWGNKESISGPGSTLKNTEKICKQLAFFIDIEGVKSICDLPCGDFNWQPHLLQSCSGIKRYIGADIVHDVLENAKQKYKMHQHDLQHMQCDFVIADLLSYSIPKVDLLIVRDCLVHLPNEEVAFALQNIKQSQCKYFAITCFEGINVNKQIYRFGDWRKLNLCLQPFILPEPYAKLKEQERSKWLYIWKNV